EGASTAFGLGSFTDAGAGDSPWHVDVNWGDGSDHTTFTSSPGSLGSQDHTYADNGDYTVTVKVTDKDGGVGTATFQAQIANVAPKATIDTAPTSGDEGSPLMLTGHASDPSSA